MLFSLINSVIIVVTHFRSDLIINRCVCWLNIERHCLSFSADQHHDVLCLLTAFGTRWPVDRLGGRGLGRIEGKEVRWWFSSSCWLLIDCLVLVITVPSSVLYTASLLIVVSGRQSPLLYAVLLWLMMLKFSSAHSLGFQVNVNCVSFERQLYQLVNACWIDTRRRWLHQFRDIVVVALLDQRLKFISC